MWDLHLITISQARNKAFKKCKNSQEQHDFVLYKRHRSEAQSRMGEAQRSYFAEKIIENKNDPKKLWKSFKEIGWFLEQNYFHEFVMVTFRLVP